jgi:hypothetical protein
MLAVKTLTIPGSTTVGILSATGITLGSYKVRIQCINNNDVLHVVNSALDTTGYQIPQNEDLVLDVTGDEIYIRNRSVTVDIAFIVTSSPKLVSANFTYA